MSHVTPPETSPAVLPFDLSGKRVVVVGGKRAMGLGVAQAARAAGARVTIASRKIATGHAPDLVSFDQAALDMRDEASIKEAFEAIGPFDHLVVTAGPAIGSWGSFMDPDMRGVRDYMDGKFMGTWACARYATPTCPPPAR